MTQPQVQTQLPDNAYRELKPGETYTPMVPSAARIPEVTTRSVLFGIAMCVLFSMAASYLALKVGHQLRHRGRANLFGRRQRLQRHWTAKHQH